MLTLIALQQLKVARVGTFVFAAVAGLAILTGMQAYVNSDPWGLLDSLSLVASFRLASSVPFYLSVYPQQLGFTGADWQSLLFGHVFWGVAPQYPQVVFDFMYPVDVSARGSAPVNAVLSAYAEDGIAYAVAMMFIVGIVVGLAARYACFAKQNGLRFAFYLSLMTLVYYTTQVQLSAVLWLSYGIKWAVLALVAVGILHRVLSRSSVSIMFNLFD